MIIAVDFDGTCVEHSYPNIGKDIGAQRVLHKLVKAGHSLILWTMRSNFPVQGLGEPTTSGLEEAVNWFKKNEIPLSGVNCNPTQKDWTNSPKCYAQLYIDDAALGIPLIEEKYPDSEMLRRSYVDWNRVEELLIEKGIL